MRAALDRHTPRPASAWTEEDGDVLWWAFPVEEPPWLGSPLVVGRRVALDLYDADGRKIGSIRTRVGGWPGYHTHWTPPPDAATVQASIHSPQGDRP